MAKLLGYDYEILYKPGEKNYATDALSRVVGNPSLYTLFAPQVELWEEIKKKKNGGWTFLYGKNLQDGNKKSKDSIFMAQWVGSLQKPSGCSFRFPHHSLTLMGVS